jgi:Flp pilus assembly protein TadD
MARLLSPLLADPVRGVRVEAAARLSEVPANLLSPSARPAFGKALDEYVAAQRYMSDLPSGPFNLGNLYARQGRPAEAERQYRRALRIDGELTEAKVNLALLLAGERRAEEALSLLREAHAAHPRLANVAFNLGLLLAEQGQPSEAERVLRDVLSADPTLAAAAHNLAVLVGPHRPGEAIALSRRAAALAPDEPRYAVALAFHQAKAQDFAGAVATLEALTLLHPTYGETYLSLGEIYERLGRLNDARALYARARDATDLSPEIRAALAARAGRLAAHDAGK